MGVLDDLLRKLNPPPARKIGQPAFGRAGVFTGRGVRLFPREKLTEAVVKEPQTVSIANESIAVGATKVFDVKGTFVLQELHLDIPKDMDADLELDNSNYFRVRDGQGAAGPIKLGGRSVSKVRLTVTNDGTASRDVRAWMVSF